MLNYHITSQPAAEPVSLEVAQQHLRVDFDDDDYLITAYIVAARKYAEQYCNRLFFNQNVTLYRDYFPMYHLGGTRPAHGRNEWPYYGFYQQLAIQLPLPRLQSVSSITYTDQSGAQQTLDPSAYVVDPNSEPARIMPSFGSYWPYTNLYLPGSIAINYVAGSYGDGVKVNTCPGTIVSAILLIVGALYENREAYRIDSGINVQSLPIGVQALLDTERFVNFSYEAN